ALLRRLLPANRRPSAEDRLGTSIEALGRRLAEAERLGDREREGEIRNRIAELLAGRLRSDTEGGDALPLPALSASDLVRAVEESLAFRTSVTTHSALMLATQDSSPAGTLVAERVRETMR